MRVPEAAICRWLTRESNLPVLVDPGDEFPRFILLSRVCLIVFPLKFPWLKMFGLPGLDTPHSSLLTPKAWHLLCLTLRGGNQA